jgi:alkylation response protein AidB-like acyl-CoA dehydrogenase
VDLRLSREQIELQTAARSFVDREAPSDEVAAWFREGPLFHSGLYRKAAEAGWLGMVLPHDLGGGGAEWRDCAVVFEQLGRGPVPGPFFSSGVLAPMLIWEAGSPEQQRRLIPVLCRGELICAVALSDDPRGWDPEVVTATATADADGDHHVLTGRKRFVHDAQGATHVLCAARGPEGTILAVVDLADAAVEVRPHKGFLASLHELELHSVRVAHDAVLGGAVPADGALDRAVERSLPILAAFQVGACQRVFEMTVAYTKERIVFGQPIGRFQRVQDHCVDLVNHLDAARWITYETLWKVDSGRPAWAAVHEAKAVASEAYYEVCNAAHKVFAGPGTALDHPLHAHTLVSRTLYQFLGDPAYHKERMIQALVEEKLRA